MKKIITYGTFDLFHVGHYNILKRAKEHGDYLVVGVTGENYDIGRGKLNVHDSLATRIENVQKTGFADEIIVEEYEGQKIDVRAATNAPCVELFVNGKSMGRQSIDHEKGLKLLGDWQVLYEKGKIEAVALDENGKELAEILCALGGLILAGGLIVLTEKKRRADPRWTPEIVEIIPGKERNDQNGNQAE